MNLKDTLFHSIYKPQDFAFDDRVAGVFDDMVARSIPFYHEIQRIQADLVMDFLPKEGAVVCDLGCSTGTTLEYLVNHSHCPACAIFFGFDNSVPMLEKAAVKLARPVDSGRVILRTADLTNMPALPSCNVIILNWSLQFVRPIERELLLKKVFAALDRGGLLLLSEKVLANDAMFNRLYIEHYLHFKKTQSGYTDAENQRKREALENVLVPYRLDENLRLLEMAGFQHRDVYFQWLNFVCMIAVKT